MPVTPFHFGPGALIKSVLLRQFSFFVFVLSHVIIDCETAWNIFSGHERLHTFFHTYLGSLVIVGVLAFTARPLFKFAMAIWDLRERPKKQMEQLPMSIILTSAFIGVWSHVLLDSIMHGDITPFSPFSNANPFLDIVTLDQLHLGCLFSGVLGGLIWALRFRMAKNQKN